MYRLMGVFAAAAVLPSCIFYSWEQVGENTYGKTTVRFELASGEPLVAAQAYILETPGNTQQITEVVKTDGDGQVRLDGYYCLPVIVAVDGGAAVVEKDSLLDSYTVVVREDRTPDLLKGYGAPIPEHLKSPTVRQKEQYC